MSTTCRAEAPPSSPGRLVHPALPPAVHGHCTMLWVLTLERSAQDLHWNGPEQAH